MDKGKPWIHFGSLEGQERARRATLANEGGDAMDVDSDGVTLESLASQPKYMELSETSKANQAEYKAYLDELDRKQKARQLAVPTDDKKVRERLRELGEPQCLFGEGPGDRRDRLRDILSCREGYVFSESEESSDEEEQQEEFFTPGTDELLQSRKRIAAYSVPRARLRIAKERQLDEIPLPQVKAFRKDLHNHLEGYMNWSSQVADDRPVTSISISPDSKMVATGAWSGMIKLWNIPNCDHVKSFRGHNDRVGGLAFHPQATMGLDKGAANFVSGGSDGKVLLWSLDRETPLATLDGHLARVARVGFHPSGNYVGSAGYDGTWRFWDVETTQELLLQEGHAKEVHAIGFQEDGALVATGGLDAIGRVWDLRTGRSAMSLEGHIKEIVAVDFAPNGYQVATGSGDNSVRIWDIRSLRSIYTIPAHTSLVSDLKFYHQSPQQSYQPHLQVNGDAHHPHAADYPLSGLYLVTSSFDGTIKIWTADDWKLVKSMGGHEGKVMGVDVSADNRWIASAGFDRTFKLWNDEHLPIL